ncbi:MAG: hypothetical protein ABFS34_13540 [Gemmatimonadota bacterium]
MNDYTSLERFWLGALGTLGAVGLNGAFSWGIFHPELVRGALGNPLALAFALPAAVLIWPGRKGKAPTLASVRRP